MAEVQTISNEPLLAYQRTRNDNEKDKDTVSTEHNEFPEDTEVEAAGGVGTLETVAGVAGNLLEWYEVVLFGLFSDVIGDVFFPPQSGHSALMESFLVFGCAFIVRPVGGLIIGYIGDTSGRKVALVTSIFLMVLGTFTLGCLPSYSRVGRLAIVLLVIVRLLQGISLGGQVVSSAIFTMESHPKERWGLYGSMVLSVSEIGCLIGSLVATSIRACFTYEQLVSFGWRIPFWFGALGVIPGIILQCCVKDRGIQDQDLSDGDEINNPIKVVFGRLHRRALFSCMLVSAFNMGMFYLNFVWLPIFMTSLLETPIPYAFATNSLAVLVFLLLAPPIGMLSDCCGERKIMLVGMAGTMVLGPVAIYVITMANPVGANLAQICLAVTMCFGMAPWFAFIAKSFPSMVRLTGVGLGVNISSLLVGGTLPAFATYLVDKHGIHTPGYIFTAVSIIGIFGLCIAPKFDEDVDNVETMNGVGDEEVTLV